MHRTAVLTLALGIVGCMSVSARMDTYLDSPVLARILEAPEFSTVMANPAKHRLQILLSEVKHSFGRTTLVHHSFRQRPREYFYPASLVKLPAALLALEKLHGTKGILWTTPYEVTRTSCEKKENEKPLTQRQNIKDDILASITLSDNPAFDRLYSWTGPGYLTDTLRARGYSSIQITHRLGARCSPFENRITHPVTFYPEGALPVVQDPIVSEAYHAQSDDSGLIPDYPGDLRSFGQLADFHWMTIAALLPDAVEPRARFQISEEERLWIARAMSRMPEEYHGAIPVDLESMQGSPLKFLLMGGSKEKIPPNIRILSKSGKALGFLSETGLYIDTESNTAFFLSAVVYVNYVASGEDDDHHYDDIGLPFMRDLGRKVLEYERTKSSGTAPFEKYLNF